MDNLKWIGGLRGVLSQIVFLNHYYSLYYNENHRFRLIGQSCVEVFYMLSGFLITYKFYYQLEQIKYEKEIDIEKYNIKKYVLLERLPQSLLNRIKRFFQIVVIAACVSIGFQLLAGFDVYITFYLYDIYITMFKQAITWNNSFWTISKNIESSIMTYAFMLITMNKSFNKRILYLLVLFPYYNSSYMKYDFYIGNFNGSFIYGILFTHYLIKFNKITYNWFYNFIICLITVPLVWFWCYDDAYATEYGSLMDYVIIILNGNYHNLFWRLSSFLLLICIQKSSVLRYIMTNRLFVFLGRISPMVYAIHWCVIMHAMEFTETYITVMVLATLLTIFVFEKI